MKIILAPDSFKGTLSSEKVIKILKEELLSVFPDCEVVEIPMADGGEGTERIMVNLTGGYHKIITVTGPREKKITAGYGILNKETALVEMASASGLTLLQEEEKNPLYTSTYGTGELIKQALEDGYQNIIVAVGGSATNDGGMGAMRALGVRFLDHNKEELYGRGEDLCRVRYIDSTNIHASVRKTKITVMCDVKNPLLGPNGATYTYGPQKGADENILIQLEQGMENYASVIKQTTGIDIGSMPGAGAAGGLSGALNVFCGGILQSGIETILETVHFRNLLHSTDLVITGEGRVDGQSAKGKVLTGIGKYCKEEGIPALAIVGGIGPEASDIYEKGIVSIMPSVSDFISREEGFSRAEEMLRDAAKRMFLLLKIGKDI